MAPVPHGTGAIAAFPWRWRRRLPTAPSPSAR